MNHSKIEPFSKQDYINKIDERNSEKRLKNLIKNDNNEFVNKSKFLCDCQSNLIKTYFDRDKNEFICKNCRMDVKKIIYLLF